MGPPQPIPSFLHSVGGEETYFTYQHKGGFILCPCASQWGCTAPPPFWCQTHQCLSRLSTQQKCLWASQPTGGLRTTSLGKGGNIPRGPEWRSRTSVGHSAKATTLGDGVHQWGHLTADNSSQNHPGGLSGSSPSMVIDTGFLPHSVRECPSEVVTGPSLTEQIAHLLLNPMFEIPGESSTCNSPHSDQVGGNPQSRRGTPGLPEATTSLPSGIFTGGYSQPLSSLQPVPPSPGILKRGTSPTPLALSANSTNLSVDVLHLQEEMNSIMVHLFSVRAAMHTCHQWVISETEVGHCQKEIDTSQVIREIKVWYAAIVGYTEKGYRTPIRKVEAICLDSTSKAEVTWATGIRKAEAANAAWASKLQWQHQEAMPNLEEEALKEEKCAHQSFLWACGAALQACPNDALAKLIYSSIC